MEHGTRTAHRAAELTQVDLAGFVLELAVWGRREDELAFLDRPPVKARRQAVELLTSLGALDPDGSVTELGRVMVAIPAHPRLARMIAERRDALSCVIAAIVDDRDVLRGGPQRVPADLELRVRLVTGDAEDERADRRGVARVRRQAEDLARRIGIAFDSSGIDPTSPAAHCSSGSPSGSQLAVGPGSSSCAPAPTCSSPTTTRWQRSSGSSPWTSIGPGRGPGCDSAHRYVDVMADATESFEYTPLLPLGPDTTEYRLLTSEGVSTFETPAGTFLRVDPAAITALTEAAMRDIAHFLRTDHLAQLRKVLDDPEASDNDRFVALDLLKNAAIAAGGVLPMCQDTGTAIVKAKKGEFVFTGGGDEAAIAEGVARTYLTSHLRYSQLAPLSMYEETNTGNNLPAEIKIAAVDGEAYSFLFIAKGGGSANKTYLYQETKALLNEATLLPWIFDKLQALGTAACPPYHLAVVIGGTSAEFAVETAKLASTHYLDSLPTTGSPSAHGFRDVGAGGQGPRAGPADGHRCPVRGQVLLPRRADHPPPPPRGELPGGDGGVVLGRPPGQSEDHPGRDVPRAARHRSGAVPPRPPDRARRRHRGPAGGRRQPQPADARDPRPALAAPGRNTGDADRSDDRRPRHRPRQAQGTSRRRVRNRRRTCATTACTTPGRPRRRRGTPPGSFGPTTAGRMDSYVDQFQAAGGSMIMLAKGNRSRQVTEACARHGGFYLGSIGGPAARLALDNITRVEVLEYPELGMEAVWKIEVVDFPAFIVVDDKGNDLFEQVRADAAAAAARPPSPSPDCIRASEGLAASEGLRTPSGPETLRCAETLGWSGHGGDEGLAGRLTLVGRAAERGRHEVRHADVGELADSLESPARSHR